MGSLRSLQSLKWFDEFEPENLDWSESQKESVAGEIEYMGSYATTFPTSDPGVPVMCRFGFSRGYRITIYNLPNHQPIGMGTPHIAVEIVKDNWEPPFDHDTT